MIANETGQQRRMHVEKFLHEGTIPLGQVETLSKRMIAFPNSHIHTVTTLENKGMSFAECYERAETMMLILMVILKELARADAR